MGKLINRITGKWLLISSFPGSALRMHVGSHGKLLISSFPGSALRMHVEWLCKPSDVNKHSQSLARLTLDHLISKDMNLVFSMYMIIHQNEKG